MRVQEFIEKWRLSIGSVLIYQNPYMTDDIWKGKGFHYQFRIGFEQGTGNNKAFFGQYQSASVV